MIKSRKYVTLVAILLIIALTAFTVQAILDTREQGEPVSGTPVTGSAVDVPEDEDYDLTSTINKAADWLLQDNQ